MKTGVQTMDSGSSVSPMMSRSRQNARYGRPRRGTSRAGPPAPDARRRSRPGPAGPGPVSASSSPGSTTGQRRVGHPCRPDLARQTEHLRPNRAMIRATPAPGARPVSGRARQRVAQLLGEQVATQSTLAGCSRTDVPVEVRAEDLERGLRRAWRLPPMRATSSGASSASARVRASVQPVIDEVADARQLRQRGVQVEQRHRSAGQAGERPEGGLGARPAATRHGRRRRRRARSRVRSHGRCSPNRPLPSRYTTASGSHASSRRTSSEKRACSICSMQDGPVDAFVGGQRRIIERGRRDGVSVQHREARDASSLRQVRPAIVH